MGLTPQPSARGLFVALWPGPVYFIHPVVASADSVAAFPDPVPGHGFLQNATNSWYSGFQCAALWGIHTAHTAQATTEATQLICVGHERNTCACKELAKAMWNTAISQTPRDHEPRRPLESLDQPRRARERSPGESPEPRRTQKSPGHLRSA